MAVTHQEGEPLHNAVVGDLAYSRHKDLSGYSLWVMSQTGWTLFAPEASPPGDEALSRAMAKRQQEAAWQHQ